jgi:hypothetical protein
MDDRAAIIASLVDVRNIAEHSSVVLKIHVPQERALEVIATFGWPTGANPVPVAIARLDTNVAPPKLVEALGDSAPKERLAGERHKFHELPMPTQAAIKSQDVTFQLWASAQSWGEGLPDAASAIRRFCGVNSRADILPGTGAGDLWISLLREYEGFR